MGSRRSAGEGIRNRPVRNGPVVSETTVVPGADRSGHPGRISYLRLAEERHGRRIPGSRRLWPKRGRKFLRPAFLPEVICRVVEETGCGFLFDTAHASLAAHGLNVNIREYIDALPTEYTREIHITGIQRFEGRWVRLARQFGIDADVIQRFTGSLQDHFPMTDEDWEFCVWAMEQARGGVWGHPWMMTFEYGGDGGLSGAVTEANVLVEQVPRLYALVKE